MADNFAFTPGSGATGAADDIGGVLYPRVKLAQGADGSATDVSSAAPLQVTLANTSANSTAVKVDNSAVTQPISAASLPLPSGAATESTLAGVLTTSDFDSKIGSLTETAPASDTASSGINGRLQRIAQRLTSLIALLPTSLGAGGGLKIDGSGTSLPVSGTFWQTTQPVSLADNSHVTFGAKADAKSTATDTTAVSAMSVWKQISASVQAIASSVAGTLTATVTQSGTWTVQPGNTANTTPWLATQTPATSGGLSIYSGSIGATATSVKGSAGQVYGWYIYNSNASAVYVQVFNVVSGSVTLGTTSPTFSLGIPASSGANVSFDSGIAMGTAITVAVTTTRSGSTGPGSTVDLNIFYK